MIAAGFLITANDAAVKWVSADYPAGQILFVRSMFTFVVIALIVHFSGGITTLRVVALPRHCVRAVLTISGTFLFIWALRAMPLVEAIAITFAAPIILTALAPVLLGEQVGRRRWLAVLVGFLGILVMLRPTPAGLNWVALLPLGAALCEAFKDLVTRRMLMVEHTNSILVVGSASIAVTSLLTLPAGWAPIVAVDLAVMAGSGLILGAGYYFIIEAYRYGEATIVSPFKYTIIVWATLLGVVLWQDIPDTSAIMGSVLVVASGLYIFYREAHRSHAVATDVDPKKTALD